MGIYLNPNNENFKRTLKRPIYVDKTMMISVINEFMASDNTYICISRPRRFGKTIAGNMLSAYFSKGCDSRELFSPYKIASDPSFESNLNRLNVIKIDMNSEYRIERQKEELLNNLTDRILAEMKAQGVTNYVGGFDKLWSWFGWSNQTLAVFMLWAITVYLVQQHKPYVITLIPAVFMTVVCSTFLVTEQLLPIVLDNGTPEGKAHIAALQQQWTWILAAGSGIVSIVWFCLWYMRKRKDK